MTNRDEANKLASKITGETVNAQTTKGALEAISGKKAGSIAQAIDDIVKGDIPGGDADLEDNHATTIDVSAYTDPVEVTPAEGKDGMKKNTITLSNIPSIEDEIDTLWTIGKFNRLFVDGIEKVSANAEYIATLVAFGASGNVWQENDDFGKRIQGTLTFSKSIKILQSINAYPDEGNTPVVLKVGTITSVEVRYGEWNSGDYNYIIYHYSDGTVSEAIDLKSWSFIYQDEEDKLLQIK